MAGILVICLCGCGREFYSRYGKKYFDGECKKIAQKRRDDTRSWAESKANKKARQRNLMEQELLNTKRPAYLEAILARRATDGSCRLIYQPEVKPGVKK